MRHTAIIAAACALVVSAGAQSSDAQSFDAALKVCAAKNPWGVAAAMQSLGATAMTTDETDIMRLSQSIATAAMLLHQDANQAKAEAEAIPATPEYFAWRLERVTVITMTMPGEGSVCTVAAPFDAFEATLAALKGVLAYGEPEKTLAYSVNRLAAWDTGAFGPMPGVLLFSADFGGDRKPTTIQFLTK